MTQSATLPRFELPSYREFVRHLWCYRNDDGDSAVSSPPVMFTIYYDDDAEFRVLRETYDRMVNVEVEGWVGRIRAEGQLTFSDLQALYEYLGRLCETAREGDLRAHRLGEYVLWVLGFRWV